MRTSVRESHPPLPTATTHIYMHNFSLKNINPLPTINAVPLIVALFRFAAWLGIQTVFASLVEYVLKPFLIWKKSKDKGEGSRATFDIM